MTGATPTVTAPPTDKPAAAPAGRPVFKLLLKLDSDNDHEVLSAARMLVSSLKASGSDLRTLADALQAEWDRQQAARPRPPPRIVWFEVDAAIDSFVSGKTVLTTNRLLKALHAVPGFRDRDLMDNAGLAYVYRRLRQLGFVSSSTFATWQRRGRVVPGGVA